MRSRDFSAVREPRTDLITGEQLNVAAFAIFMLIVFAFFAWSGHRNWSAESQPKAKAAAIDRVPR